MISRRLTNKDPVHCTAVGCCWEEKHCVIEGQDHQEQKEALQNFTVLLR